MEVLNLLLECLINETTNETAIVYSYVSTKENGTAAVMMNLPFSVLGLIPWYCDFENSPMGSKPETFEDWFWKPLATFGLLIAGVIITIGMTFVEIFTMMINFFKEVFLDILPILKYIIWLIICAIILILVFILFALELLSFALLFIQLCIIFILFSIILEVSPEIMGSSLGIQKNNSKFSISYKIGMNNDNFLDLNVPTISVSQNFNNSIHNSDINYFNQGPSIKLSNFNNLILKQSTSDNQNSNSEDGVSLWNGASTILGTFSILETSNFLFRIGMENEIYERILDCILIISVIGMITGIIQFIFDFPNEEKRIQNLAGMMIAIGFILIINLILWNLVSKGLEGGSGITKIVKIIVSMGLIIELFAEIIDIISAINQQYMTNLGFPPPTSTNLAAIGFLMNIIVLFKISHNKDRKPIVQNWLFTSIVIFALTIFLFGTIGQV